MHAPATNTVENCPKMAVPLRLFFLFSLTLISTHLTPTHGVFSEQSTIELPTDQPQAEKLTRLHFFYHDILEGKNPTVVQIIDPPSEALSGFGTTFMMDNLLTEGPELSSKPVGRAQGMFGLASLEDRGMVMLINLAFSEGGYAGSTLSMLGRNPVQDTVREMPIVGGTGVFRFAKGYAIAKSLWEISDSEHFVVEYHVTVSHP
ncbi:Dirigent protein 21 [Spatholobus suberectus]|nr:Dirigent protein 21 [Spatholobus suberectus]